jgi:hypothetical protein
LTREQFEHAIRATGAILDRREVLVIGSQAVHGTVARSPPEAERSIEVYIAVPRGEHGRLADVIDGAIGERSVFQETFGYYAQGVTERTATLPPGWREPLVPYETPGTNGVRALCLELHDLWLSKAVAGREKDREFCRSLASRGLVSPSTLRERPGAGRRTARNDGQQVRGAAHRPRPPAE